MLNELTSTWLLARADDGPDWLGAGFRINGGTCCRVIVTVARFGFLSYIIKALINLFIY
jgi:hypothetical protein